MPGKHIFISHSRKDADFVEELREALEELGLPVWIATRDGGGGGGARLSTEIGVAIEQARQYIVVLSPNTINSPWVRQEVQKAEEAMRRREDEGYRIVTLLLPGLEPSALSLWFDEGPQEVVQVEAEPDGLSRALPQILAALGERPPGDAQAEVEEELRPVEELTLRLHDLKFETQEGKRRARAVAQLVYASSVQIWPRLESERFDFTAPLGPIEVEELRWYLEEYHVWPVGIFQERAARVEARLPEWGQDLYRAALEPQAAQEALHAWQKASESKGTENAERRFSIFVDGTLTEGASLEDGAAAGEVAAELLALPWELLHDGRQFLFHGERPVRVRRRLPDRSPQEVRQTQLPLRILLVSPRPEDARMPFIDHRFSARPLVEALEGLGELALLSILTPPTLPALEAALRNAADAGEPFDVLHFDGQGVYDRTAGVVWLSFENPNDMRKWEQRGLALVSAEQVAEIIRDQRIPLVFLESGQSAETGAQVTSSVAAKLLEDGVSSVVAMSHDVLVETVRRFVQTFYGVLAAGRRIGTAMLEGQRELHRDTYRGRLPGAGELRLQDWFVPVLYQEEQDLRLVSRLPRADVQELQATSRRLSLGSLPDPPPYGFHGRSRELLTLERMLADVSSAVVRGLGGEGKTALAVELARWLVRTNRFARAAFVSVDNYQNVLSVLDSLGQQLLPEGEHWSVASYSVLTHALQPVERALRERPTIIVLDNLESVLAGNAGLPSGGSEVADELFDLCRRLLDAAPDTRIIFTTREPLPSPFNDRRRELLLGALGREDAVALAGEVWKHEGITPRSDDPGADPQEIVELVEVVNRHALALVLLAREVAHRGIRGTAENFYRLMEDLHRRYPNDHENSLYASVELALRRLPAETREQIKPLAVFHGGAHLGVLMQMLGVEQEAVNVLATQLLEVGLAGDAGYGHLRLVPALSHYLLRELSGEEQESLSASWAEAMTGLASFLYRQRFEDAAMSGHLTRMELPNLLALLSRAQERETPEAVVTLAQDLESLFSGLGLQQALAQVTSVREQAAKRLEAWGRARFLAETANVNRMLERGDVRAALYIAQRLLEQCQEAGEEAYPDASYDISVAYVTLGGVLQTAGAAEDALLLFKQSSGRFKSLADGGNDSAQLMTSVTLAAVGDCLRDLGRLQEASAAYGESIDLAQRLGNMRQVAAVKGQLGTANLLGKNFDAALEAYEEARSIFESLGDQQSVCTAWHQIGITYRQAGLYREAERASRQALALAVQLKERAGEGGSLCELGVLYFEMGLLEDSVVCYRQAADVFASLGNQFSEGSARNNLAISLLAMYQFKEARSELHRSIECRRSLGHVAQLWKTWNILQRLEEVLGNKVAAIEARQRAIETFMAFRRDGGENLSPGAVLCGHVNTAVGIAETANVEEELPRYLGLGAESWAKVMIPKLQAILSGERSPALADDPDLDYDDAVELQLLLERLTQT